MKNTPEKESKKEQDPRMSARLSGKILVPSVHQFHRNRISGLRRFAEIRTLMKPSPQQTLAKLEIAKPRCKIDLLLSENYELKTKNEQCSKYIDELIHLYQERCENSEEIQELIEKEKQAYHDSVNYLKQKVKDIDELKEQISRLKIERIREDEKLNRQNVQITRVRNESFYKINRANEEIENLKNEKQENYKRLAILNHKYRTIQHVYSESLKNQGAIKERLPALENSEEKQHYYYSICNMQMNYDQTLGWNIVEQEEREQDKIEVLQRKKVRWNEDKMKLFQFIDFKRWVIIGCFVGWRKIAEIDHKSLSFAIMLGEDKNKEGIEDINVKSTKTILTEAEAGTTNLKKKKHIFYKNEKKIKIWIKKIVEDLGSFQTPFMKIDWIGACQPITETPHKSLQLKIQYHYLEKEREQTYHFYHLLNPVVKKKLYEVWSDPRYSVLCMIDVNSLCTFEEEEKLSQLWSNLITNQK